VHVARIYTAHKKGAPVKEWSHVDVTTHGILNDRHQDGTVTLVEWELVREAPLVHAGYRRQVCVWMGDLSLRLGDCFPPGARLQIGGVQLEALERCEPCARLAKRLGVPAPPRGLVHTGLRCRILTPGSLSEGCTLGELL
jgi:hypothetical protein